MSYSNILVAVDTTDEADDILEAAKDVLNEESGTISIVCVLKPLTGFYVDMYSALADSPDVESQAVDRATGWLADLASRHGIDANEVKVIIGSPAVEIRKMAEHMGADLIVIGTHGQHGLGLMLGSTANSVLHGVHCNVLAVRVRTDGRK